MIFTVLSDPATGADIQNAFFKRAMATVENRKFNTNVFSNNVCGHIILL